MKTCTGCHMALSREAFTRHVRRADGLSDRCRACKKAAAARHYLEHKAEIRAKNNAYATTHADWKRESDARCYAQNRDRRRAQHKEWLSKNGDTKRLLDADYYRANREDVLARNRSYRSRPDVAAKLQEYHREWSRRNRAKMNEYASRRRARHARARIVHISDDQLAQRLSVFDNACVVCASTEDLTIDHVKSLFRGGPHMLGNLVPMCRSCNSRKGHAGARPTMHRGVMPLP